MATVDELAVQMERGEICGVCGKNLTPQEAQKATWQEVGKKDTYVKFPICCFNCQQIFGYQPQGHIGSKSPYSLVYRAKKKKVMCTTLL